MFFFYEFDIVMLKIKKKLILIYIQTKNYFEKLLTLQSQTF